LQLNDDIYLFVDHGNNYHWGFMFTQICINTGACYALSLNSTCNLQRVYTLTWRLVTGMYCVSSAGILSVIQANHHYSAISVLLGKNPSKFIFPKMTEVFRLYLIQVPNMSTIHVKIAPNRTIQDNSRFYNYLKVFSHRKKFVICNNNLNIFLWKIPL